MIIKVCGIKYQDNLDLISNESIDMVGFNFYPKSKRYLDLPLDFDNLPGRLKKVGVFVNAPIEEVNKIISLYKLDMVQLHGGESSEYCTALQMNVPVIKVFSINSASDFSQTNTFEQCEYFLFDTKTPEFGGSGHKFGWELLQHYQGSTPFLLAGGIGPDDVSLLESISHPSFAGIDINSRFEVSPGMKDVHMIKVFMNELQKNKNNNIDEQHSSHN